MLAQLRHKIIRDLLPHKKLAWNVFYLTALRAVQILMGLASTYFVVRALSKESFGEYHFILACTGTLTVFSLSGLNNAVMQSIARGFQGSYRKAVPVSFFSCLIGSVFLGGIALWQFSHGQKELALGFIFAMILFPFVHGLTHWKNFHTGRENFRDFFIHNSLGTFVMYSLVIAAVLIKPGTLLAPLLFALLVPAMQNLLLTILIYKKVPVDSPVEEGSISYGLKTSFYSAFNIIALNIDKLLLFFFLSPAALATYVAASRISDLFKTFVQDTGAALAPKFAKSDTYTKKLDFYLKFFVFLYGAAIVAFAFTILPWLIILLFGNNYADSIPYAQALMCSVAIGNIGMLRFRFIRSKIDPDSYRNITMYSAIAHIAVSCVLIPWLGITGAVISVFLHRIITTLVVNATIQSRYPIQEAL